MALIKCPECGKELEADKNVTDKCPECGEKLEKIVSEEGVSVTSKKQSTNDNGIGKVLQIIGVVIYNRFW